MIEETNYLNNLGRAKALLQFLKDDAVKYAAYPAAKKFVIERNQAKIKDLEDFIISVIGYVQELEESLDSSDELIDSLEKELSEEKSKSKETTERIVHRYHFPKDKETIRMLSISAVMSAYNDLF
jgi:peptidoglycan hydrolase CwlO-like protein